MKTIKLKIMNDFECAEELRLFNDILRFSYNRFKEGLKEIEVRARCREVFKGLNSWFVQCAIKEGKAVFEKFKEKKVIFGGKKNLRDYIKNLISKKEYKQRRLSPITIQGEACKSGNRLFNFYLNEEMLEFKFSRTDHREIQLPKLRGNLKLELSLLQELIEQKKATVTAKFNEEFIWLTYDESLLDIQKYKDLKENRVLGIDLNPNYIGLSVLEFDSEDKFKVLFKKVFDVSLLNKTSKKSSTDKKSIYLTNKRKFELIEICHEISRLMNYWKCKKLCIEDLNIKSSDKKQGRYFNRLCNNVWDRDLVVNKLKMLRIVHGFELVEVNPAYSSFVGNMLYGDKNTPDMIASSIEIARRGYKKFEKGWFYPTFNVESVDEHWKQTLAGIGSWKEAFKKVKESGLKYRFQLKDSLPDAVFSKFYFKKHWKLYAFK